ncbi:hypothetical protein NDU88_011604 [Pleurodeles waltl]|uniref:CCHC-type domain-containing protein n=1 Tax=Pleurodeles waltl TaxID=8319 RepID=A0AAV7Q3S5_PLEWA|nr:hypothetical protein NDU88_011604 [Pleurodeles waltl]
MPTSATECGATTPVLNRHLSFGEDIPLAFETPVPTSTFGLKEDLGMSAQGKNNEEEHGQLAHLSRETDRFQEEVNTEREKIQRSIHNPQDKIDSREWLILTQSCTRALKGKGENSCTDDALLNARMTAPQIVLGGTAMLKPWTPLEAAQMAKDAPDPFTASVKYYEWLHKICIAYTPPLPRDVETLLKLGYGSRWSLIKSAFHIPQERDWTILTNNMDVTENRLMNWLESVRDTLNGLAVKHGDFSQVTATLQKSGESVADYILRFNEAWDNTAGVPRMTEACKVLATQTLMNGLLASVAHSCKLRHPDWSAKGYQELCTPLATMERDGIFKVKKGSAKTDKGMMLPQVQQEEEPEGMYYQGARHRQGEGQGHQRRDMARDQCYVCLRYGHWGRNCKNYRGRRDRNDRNDRYERKDRNNRYDRFDRDKVQPSAPPMPRDIKQTQHSLRNPFQERHGSA